MHQLSLPLDTTDRISGANDYQARLLAALSGDLDFHHDGSGYAVPDPTADA